MSVTNKDEGWKTATGLILGYTIHCSLRKLFSMSLAEISLELQFSKVKIGEIYSIFYIAYGCSKLFSGVLSDFVSSKIMIINCLLWAAVVFYLISIVSNFSMLCMLMCFNGVAMGLGPPAFSKLVITSIPSSWRGSVWSTISLGGNIGYMLSPMVMIAVTGTTWRIILRNTSILGFITAIICYLLINEIISDIKATNSQTDLQVEKKETQATVYHYNKLMMKLFLKIQSYFLINDCSSILNMTVLLLIFSEAGIGFVMTGFINWMGLYFMEVSSLSSKEAAELMLASEVGGLVGTAVFGPISDLLGRRRDVTSFICTLFCIPSLLILMFYNKDHGCTDVCEQAPVMIRFYIWEFPSKFLIGMACVFVFGVALNGPKTLLSIAVRENVPSDVSGRIFGLTGLLQQFCGATAGAPLGVIIENYGWQYLLVSECVILIIIATLLGGAIVCHSFPKSSKPTISERDGVKVKVS